MVENPFEIPQSLRDVSEQNLKQAHAAYDHLVNFVARATDAWMRAMPSVPMTVGLKKVQGRCLQYTKDNADYAFAFSCEITNAETLSEVLTLLTQFAENSM